MQDASPTAKYTAVPANTKDDEELVLRRIHELVREFPRYGYRMITRMLHRKGWTVNFKRIYRSFGGVRGYECGEKAKNADSAVLPAESAVAVQTKSIMFGRTTSFLIEQATDVR